MLSESHPQVYNTSYPHNDWHLMLWWWGFRLTTSGLRALWRLCVVDASFPVSRLIPIALNFSVTRIRWESKPILGVRQSQGKAQKRRPPVFPEKTFFKSSCYGNFFVRVGPPINQKKVVWYFKQKTIKSFKSVGLDRQTISAHLGYFHFAWTGVDMAVIGDWFMFPVPRCRQILHGSEFCITWTSLPEFFMKLIRVWSDPTSWGTVGYVTERACTLIKLVVCGSCCNGWRHNPCDHDYSWAANNFLVLPGYN